MKTLTPYLLIVLLLGCCSLSSPAQSAFADSHARYAAKVLLGDWVADQTVPLPSALTLQPNYVKGARLFINFNTGENYTWGSSERYAFRVAAQFRLVRGNTIDTIDFTLDNEHPEAVFVANFANGFSGPGQGFSPDQFQIQLLTPLTTIQNQVPVAETEFASEPALFDDNFKDSLQVRISYDVEYGIDVTQVDQRLTLNPVEKAISAATDVPTRRYRFSWNDGGLEYPNYQLQLLRLYNYDSKNEDERESITTQVNWEQALNYYTENSRPEIDLIVAEGTGFYCWRVRPIGTYYEGGLANDRNYGAWTWTPDPNDLLVVNQNNNSNTIFFFQDPDEDKNWIYSRTFTEAGRVHEDITFANGLLQVKQSQSHLPSKNTTLITQTIQDYSGRATMSTLPVPVPDQNGLVFKNRFVQPADDSGDLYTARHFDRDENYRDPSPISDDPDQSDFAYYSSDNPDLSVPDAEGYAYQRTLFGNDGTGRVKEQSGVGKMHMIAEDRNGRGKTIRTTYGVPAEEELIRIFGDEAPNPQSVRKTIMVDENNTATIQYITNTGNLVATAISYQESEDDEHILPIGEQPATAFLVTDIVTKNIVSGNSFVSTKRLSLIRETPLSINYKLPCLAINEGCVTATLDCRYSLSIVIRNLTDGSSTIVVDDFDLSGACAGNNPFEQDFGTVDTLLPGEYIIEKYLVVTKDPVTSQSIKDEVLAGIRPLTGIIQDALDAVESLEAMGDFHDQLRSLAMQVNNGNLTSPEFVAAVGSDFVLDGQQIILKGDPDYPFAAEVSSTCCTIEVPLGYIPPPVCSFIVDDGDGILQRDEFPAFNEHQFGFEQYAIDFLAGSGCLPVNSPDRDIIVPTLVRELLFIGTASPLLTNFFQPRAALMRGWQVGEFDEMVFQMLSNRYAWEAGQDSVVQYDCQELMNCWQAVLSVIRDQMCNQIEWRDRGPSGTISDNVDTTAHRDQTIDDGVHDDHLEEEGSQGWFFDLFTPDFSDMARDMDIDLRTGFRIHPVKEFLDCAGYRFAAIFTPLDDPSSFPPEYQVWNNWPNRGSNAPPIPLSQQPKLFRGIRNPIFAFKYFHYDYSIPEIEITSCFRDPDTCYNESTGQFVPCCADIDGNPIPCEYCNIGEIACEQTYQDWNFGQRYAFFEKLRNYVEPERQEDLIANWRRNEIDWDRLCDRMRERYPDLIWDDQDGNPLYCGNTTNPCDFYADPYLKSINGGSDTVRTTIAGEAIYQVEKTCLESCAEKRGAIRDSLILELEKNCYLIDGCAGTENDQVIPSSHIDSIVDRMVGECESQCEVRSCNCHFEAVCRPLSLPWTKFGYDSVMIRYPLLELGVAGTPADNNALLWSIDIYQNNQVLELQQFRDSNFDFSYQDALRVQQATDWMMELRLPSKCADADQAPLQCDTTPQPENYAREARLRLFPHLRDELDLQKREGEILPVLRSEERRIQVSTNEE